MKPSLQCAGSALAGLAAILAAGAVNARAEDFASLRQRVAALGGLTSPPQTFPAGHRPAADGARALYYAGVPYRGKPTRVFSWYAAPPNRTGKVPGAVLVHGGGGTAFLEWVRKWNGRGFAAISIAVEGQVDERTGPQQTGAPPPPWKRHEWAGPARNGIYADTAQPLEDQWMYHAVAATVLANSLLRSFPEVDARNVGLAGISWGGVITSTVAGIDTRFRFAIPIYGCGAMWMAENQWGEALGPNQFYREVWDPVRYLARAKMPVLWLTWLDDNHFPLTSQRASYRAARGPRMVAVLPDMKHSHPAGWNPPDSYAFAESVARTGKPWARQRAARARDGKAYAEFTIGLPVESGSLFSTADTGYTGRRKWAESPATVEKSGSKVRLSARLPPGTTAWFFNLRSGSLTASSDFMGR